MKIGEIRNFEHIGGIAIDAEIVKVCCPACGEEFVGNKWCAGGFIAGHEAYHNHENRMDLIITSMGGL